MCSPSTSENLQAVFADGGTLSAPKFTKLKISRTPAMSLLLTPLQAYTLTTSEPSRLETSKSETPLLAGGEQACVRLNGKTPGVGGLSL